jgi:hypothetical protein
MYVLWEDIWTKWRIEMRKDTKQNNLGKADAFSKYERVGRQKNGEDFLIRQALRSRNVYE